MKILYALANHAQLSEMYVESECRFVEQSGVEVAVWSHRPPGSAYEVTRKIYRGTLAEAESDFNPDVVHFHWLTIAENHASEVKTPITVRGHSFDFNHERIQKLIANNGIKRIFLFPHQAASIQSDKVIPLKVGFDSTRYYLTPNKNRKQVVRCCAARPSKGLLDYVRIAARCPDFTFHLCVAEVYGDNKFVPMITDFAKNTPNVKVRPNLLPQPMAELMRSSSIHLHTLDLPQSVGMCISVAEAMGCGNYSLVRKTVPLTDMIDGVGDSYDNNDEAVNLINNTKSWDDVKWENINRTTAEKSLNFADYNVFPTIIEHWSGLCA